MLVQGNEILNFIPQRPPMVMVDRLHSCSDEKATTGLMILPENIFVSDDCLTEPGLIENMAQSAALMTGWQAVIAGGNEQKIPVGVIGAVKDFQVHFLPLSNSEIFTEVEILHKIANASVIHCRVKSGDRVAAEGELKIFLAE